MSRWVLDVVLCAIAVVSLVLLVSLDNALISISGKVAYLEADMHEIQLTVHQAMEQD